MPWIDRFRWGGLPLLVVAGRGGVRPGKRPLPPPPDGGRREGVDAPARPLRRRRLRRLPARHGPPAALLGARGARVGRERDHGLVGELPEHVVGARGAAVVRRGAPPRPVASGAHARSPSSPSRRRSSIVASVPEPLLAAAPPRPRSPRGAGRGAAAFASGSGPRLCGERRASSARLLAAPALAAYVVTGLDSIRGVTGALLPGFAAQGALPLARLPDLLADGVVADWTSVIRRRRDSRLSLLPVADAGPRRLDPRPPRPRGRPGRAAAGARDGRPRRPPRPRSGDARSSGSSSRAVPFASSIRYPEKYAVLFGFGVVWLAALGAAALEKALAGRGRALAFAVLALLLVLDRASITPRLLPLSPASLLEERPAVLERPAASVATASLPRGSFPSRCTGLPAGAGRTTRESRATGDELGLPLLGQLVRRRDRLREGLRRGAPASAARVGPLRGGAPRPTARCPRPSPGPRGRSAPSWASPGPGGRSGPAFGLFADPVPPFRFVDRVVRGGDPRELATRFLREGVPDGRGLRRRRRRGPRAVAAAGSSASRTVPRAGAGGRGRRARTGLPARLPARSWRRGRRRWTAGASPSTTRTSASPGSPSRRAVTSSDCGPDGDG